MSSRGLSSVQWVASLPCAVGLRKSTHHFRRDDLDLIKLCSTGATMETSLSYQQRQKEFSERLAIFAEEGMNDGFRKG